MIIMIIKCKDPVHKMGSSPPLHLLYCFQPLGRLWSHCAATFHSEPSFLRSQFIIDHSHLFTISNFIIIFFHPIYTAKLVSTWYTKLEHKTRNNPEEGALVIETILDQSKEPIRAQRCQRPSHLVFHSSKQKLVKCTSGFLLQQNA